MLELSTFPSPNSAPEKLKAIRWPSGCGPFAAWAVLEYFGLRPDPDAICAACRFRAGKGTYMADIAAALADFGLRVEYSWDQEPDTTEPEYSAIAVQSAGDAGVVLSKAQILRDLTPLLDGTRVAVLEYNTERTELHAHITPLVAIHEGKGILPFETYSPLDLDILEWHRGYPGVQRECLLVTMREASPP